MKFIIDALVCHCHHAVGSSQVLSMNLSEWRAGLPVRWKPMFAPRMSMLEDFSFGVHTVTDDTVYMFGNVLLIDRELVPPVRSEPAVWTAQVA